MCTVSSSWTIEATEVKKGRESETLIFPGVCGYFQVNNALPHINGIVWKLI